MDVRPPQQARSRTTWTRILDAGVTILEEEGHEALTIARLCDAADVTPPTIYARAPNKQALLQAVHRHAVERFAAAVRFPLPPAPADAVDAIAGAFLDRPRLVRSILRQLGGAPTLARDHGAVIATIGREFRAAVGGDTSRTDACFCVVVSALAGLVVGADLAPGSACSDREFVASLGAMAAAYLGP